MKFPWIISLLVTSGLPVHAAPVTYTIDPNHTHPSFETDHMGGMSTWRGLFKTTSGTIVLDTTAKTGTVDVKIETNSADVGLDKLNEHIMSGEMLDAQKYPTAQYQGTLGDFRNGVPSTVTGNFTLHGVTKPLNLTITSFKCAMNPMVQKEVCGADATGTFNRAQFGVNYGEQYGFKQDVLLRIQVEAIKAN